MQTEEGHAEQSSKEPENETTVDSLPNAPADGLPSLVPADKESTDSKGSLLPQPMEADKDLMVQGMDVTYPSISCHARHTNFQPRGK